MMSALFANLVIQQTNTALILLGQVPNPETGERMQDIEAAQLFIDQLEMLEIKTKGNLNAQEEKLLKQNLTTLRMAFVEIIDAAESASTASPSANAASPSDAPEAPAASTEEEARKKFSKKY